MGESEIELGGAVDGEGVGLALLHGLRAFTAGGLNGSSFGSDSDDLLLRADCEGDVQNSFRAYRYLDRRVLVRGKRGGTFHADLILAGSQADDAVAATFIGGSGT